MDSPIHFLELTPDSWNEAKLIKEQLDQYIFRGQGDNEWHLTTSIERLQEQYAVNKTAIALGEKAILDKFKTRAHQYIQSPPGKNDEIEWLSIIQDYGGPTRLLDFTQSFYIAAFFAMESASKDACVWAISDSDLLMHPLLSNKIQTNSNLFEYDKDLSYDPPEIYNNFAETIINDSKHSVDVVLKIFPKRLNERLAVQKGVFLFNCNIDNRFEHSLCKTFVLPFDHLNTNNATQLSINEFIELSKGLASELPPRYPKGHFSIAPIIKINLPLKMQIQALSELVDMNIDHASLFPGLEGFAKSLKLHFSTAHRKIRSFRISPPPESQESQSD